MQQRRRPRDLLLLALRCGVLIVLALALAQPFLGSAQTGRRVAILPAGTEQVGDSLAELGLSVINTPETAAPWSAAIRAVPLTSSADTLVLVSPAGGDRWLGPRPTLDRVVEILPVEVNSEPVVWQRSTETSANLSAPIGTPVNAVWWLVLGLLALERLVDRRSRQ